MVPLNTNGQRAGSRIRRWCPGAESNHRHRDFQSRALPTELPGLSQPDRLSAEARASLTVAFFAVHPCRIGRRAGNAIALAKPFQEVAALAATAAEGCVRRVLGLAAGRAGFGLATRARHTRPTWGQRGRPATQPRRRPAAPALPATEALPRSRR